MIRGFPDSEEPISMANTSAILLCIGPPQFCNVYSRRSTHDTDTKIQSIADIEYFFLVSAGWWHGSIIANVYEFGTDTETMIWYDMIQGNMHMHIWYYSCLLLHLPCLAIEIIALKAKDYHEMADCLCFLKLETIIVIVQESGLWIYDPWTIINSTYMIPHIYISYAKKIPTRFMIFEGRFNFIREHWIENWSLVVIDS